MGIALRYTAIDLVGRHPGTLRAYYGRTPKTARLLAGPDTDVVIEGYPRSASSFAVRALQDAQPARLRIAHHLHAAGQLHLGRRFGVPMLFLIREPESAAASLLVRNPEVSPAAALRHYRALYSAVADLGRAVVIARFTTVTSDYASVIEAVNDRFDKHFAVYRNSPKADERIFAAIERVNRTDQEGRVDMLARPTQAKAGALDSARGRLAGDRGMAAARERYDLLAMRAI